MRRFEKKIIVVTGGNSGIGLGTTKRFAEEGGRLIVIGRDQETLDQLRPTIGSDGVTIRADLGDMAEIRRVAEVIRGVSDRVDVFFANAGVSAVSPFEAVTEETWDRIMNVNLKGVFFLSQQLLPLMGRGSSIVLCGSIAAVRTYPTGSVYCASKAAIRSLGGVLANELAGRGIRVNTLSPGLIDTPIISRTQGFTPGSAEEYAQGQINATPLKRMGTPEDCAAAVLFLASDEASFVTGTEIVVDGGTIGPI